MAVPRPDCHSRVSTCLTKDLNEEVRGSVDHLRLTGKLRHRVDVARNPNTSTHAVEVAIQSAPSLRNQIQRAKARCLLAVFNRKIAAKLTDETSLAVPLRKLAGEEKQITRSRERNVVRPGRTRDGEFDTQSLKPLVDQ